MLIQSSLHATVTEAESAGASEPGRAKVTELRFEPILNDFHLTDHPVQGFFPDPNHPVTVKS